jgi:hypothetical protein
MIEESHSACSVFKEQGLTMMTTGTKLMPASTPNAGGNELYQYYRME